MRAVRIIVPPDKSISHRAIMLASISEGATRIKNLLLSKDLVRTIEAFRCMGVKILFEDKSRAGNVQGSRPSTRRSVDAIVHGLGMRGLRKPDMPLYLGNSGTTMRILPGILAGQNFSVVLKGDASLSKRPMLRIVKPLMKMGVDISGAKRQKEIYPPLKIHGGNPKPVIYTSKIASAQLKSCILLAGLFAKGLTSVTEPVRSRDHTERMLKIFGCRLRVQGSRVSLKGPVKLRSPRTIKIPGDISSASFFIVAGCILPDTKIVIKDVGLNPTRTGILDILRRMGADIKINPSTGIKNKEPMGDVVVKTSRLKGINISSEEVVRAIDEIPVAMVAACFAKGTSVIKGVGELRVKETDRIKSMVTNLRKMGALIEILPKARGPRTAVHGSVLKIRGGRVLHGAQLLSYGDHRTAMSILTAGLAIKGKVSLGGRECIDKSFPGFENLLCKIN
ncbi:3-phosphoshikimate 1-carboxyvinyltransferase [Candidatus Omnitrophota bacterium]